jgi:FMN-dependent oxidoreductase (nitrilotriacetate monooxygenase family)
MAARRQSMALVAFLQAQNCSNYVGSWRHPDTASDFLSADYYQRIATVLEAGKFHLAFFDDRLAMPDRYGDDFTETVRRGIRAVKLDPIPPMTAMGLATRRLGVGATYSTTYHEPFHVARLFATLDHLLGGRVAWNVVTSLNDSEAANFGREAHLEHDLRYDRADEFLGVVLGHWESWEDGAIVYDRARNCFADPAKVHRLDHHGDWLRSRGPFTVPRTPQGRPVIIQAGQSGRGRRFAARWAELLFVIQPSVEAARSAYRAIKEEVGAAGRNPDAVLVLPAVYCVTGQSRTEAEERLAFLESLADPLDTLVLLSEVLNFDFAARGLDDPISDADLASMGGLQGVIQRVVRASGRANPSARDFATYSGRGRLEEFPRLVGTPTDVADQIEEWFSSEACDGFVISAACMPGSYEEFARQVVPELQRRGLFHQEYTGTTLRENLGLPPARPSDWSA